MNRTLIWALVAAPLCVPAFADEDSIEHGKAVAIEACGSCHQITAEQAIQPPVSDPDRPDVGSAPSLYDVAREHGGDADYVRNAILKPTHPMPARDWNETDLKAVVDYIQSLPR